MINRSFGKGFKSFDPINNLKEKIRNKKSINNYIKGLARFIIEPEFSKNTPPERNYVYFQDFVENDGFDIRVVVINNKAVALKRLVRENDFRASGSGNLVFENELIDQRYIKLAFELNRSINSQSLVIDFIHSLDDKIYIVEISYGFPVYNFLDKAAGFWDEDIRWHKSYFNLPQWILESVIESSMINNT